MWTTYSCLRHPAFQPGLGRACMTSPQVCQRLALQTGDAMSYISADVP